MNKLLCVCLCCLALIYCGTTALALPPLGLTKIGTAFGSLEIIDGTAYIPAPGGIQTVSSTGDLGFIGVSHPTLGPLDFTTSVVKATDGKLYLGASFGDFFSPLGGALYNLDSPSAPIVTWEGDYRVVGVAGDLTVYGNAVSAYHEAIKFLLNGTVTPLAHPQGPEPNNTSLISATPNGYALGEAGIPGFPSSEPVVWTPSGELSPLNICCLPFSIRDREDGNGVNVGIDAGAVKYGADGWIIIRRENGSGLAAWSTHVSQSQFVAMYDPFYADSTKYAFYPGINPDFPNRAVPLLDIFPELAAIDIDFITGLASVDGYLYMTLSGSDGTFLFGARDPSVIVPEPAAVVMLSIIGMAAILRREWY